MRHLMIVSALVLTGMSLGGCNTGAPMGVLPRDPVPPPPSVTGSLSNRSAADERPSVSVQRRSRLSVPDRIAPPRPSSPEIEPVMTGRGAGAGFRF
ncbi:hypothetical protein [Microvirga roseola]|uniref:hypothetical protein n=1 Tax=Microvirga roseola TaxID=2883126 RepID=UPI001E39C9E5|nr:hypothetical protein [Microvirga roseola]